MIKLIKQFDLFFISIIIGLVILFIYSNQKQIYIEKYLDDDHLLNIELTNTFYNSKINDYVYIKGEAKNSDIYIGRIHSLNKDKNIINVKLDQYITYDKTTGKLRINNNEYLLNDKEIITKEEKVDYKALRRKYCVVQKKMELY